MGAEERGGWGREDGRTRRADEESREDGGGRTKTGRGEATEGGRGGQGGWGPEGGEDGGGEDGGRRPEAGGPGAAAAAAGGSGRRRVTPASEARPPRHQGLEAWARDVGSVLSRTFLLLSQSRSPDALPS